MARLRSYKAAMFSAAFLAAFAFGPAVQAADDSAALFKTKCASCHGEDGASQTTVGKAMKAADLRAEAVQKLSDDEIVQVIQKGKNKMPPTKGITPEQAKALAAHTHALGKKK